MFRNTSEIGYSKLEIQNTAAEVQGFCYFEARYNLYFNLSKSRECVQGKIVLHGRVMVLVCGTLYQQDRSVGIFEQFFIIIRDLPAFNNWKLK